MQIRQPQRVTEIEVVEAPQKKSPEPESEKEKQIVKQLEPIRPVINDAPARFDSEKTQRVQQETKAQAFGPTENRTPHTQSRQQEPNRIPDLTPTDELPEFARHVSSQSRTSASSTTNIELPGDIKNSDVTNLNTDSNIYYSFYNRVSELIYVRWEERLVSYWNRLSTEFKENQLAGKVWSTTVDIVLKENGEYYSASIVQSSGYNPFDEAAVYAFRNARYFPNPPRAKVEADGFVRLKYRFSVHVGP